MIWDHLSFRHVTFSMPHWGIFPILIEIYRSPLVYMIIHGYEIHARLMIDFILSWYSEEPLLTRSARFILFDIVVIPGWSYVECLDFPRHHFSGVHIRFVTRPIGAILGLSGQIGYIWCHTGAYFPHLAMEAIVLPHVRRSFHHPAEIYCIRLTDRCSWALHWHELLVVRRSRLVELLLAISSSLRFAAACYTGAYFPHIVSLQSGVQSRRSFTVYDIQSHHVTFFSSVFRAIVITVFSVRRSEPSSVFRSTFRVTSSVSVFRVVITFQFGVQSHYCYLV